MPAVANNAVQELFKQHFGFRPAQVTRAPATLELLGSHAAEHDGLMLTAAVSRHAYVAASPRTDGKIEHIDADRAPEVFWISQLNSSPASPWANLYKAVLRELRQRKVHFSGFNAAVYSEIPAGINMAEDAAAAVAAALMVRMLFPFSLSDSGSTIPPKRDERGHLPPLPVGERLHFARLCGTALNAAHSGDDGFVRSMTSLAGKQWHLVSIDCRFQSLGQVPFLGTALIVCDSGVRAEEAALVVAEIQGHCQSAARKLQAKSLRSVEPRTLRAGRTSLDEREFACASHITGEIQRVAAAERALEAGDHRQLGNYLSLSHESLRDTLKGSCPDLDLLVELARAHEGCLGSRAMGPGWGGATLSLVAYHSAEPFMAHMMRGYEARTGRKLKPFVCQIVDGAG